LNLPEIYKNAFYQLFKCHYKNEVRFLVEWYDNNAIPWPINNERLLERDAYQTSWRLATRKLEYINIIEKFKIKFPYQF
jgi:hypothetical protein